MSISPAAAAATRPLVSRRRSISDVLQPRAASSVRARFQSPTGAFNELPNEAVVEDVRRVIGSASIARSSVLPSGSVSSTVSSPDSDRVTLRSRLPLIEKVGARAPSPKLVFQVVSSSNPSLSEARLRKAAGSGSDATVGTLFSVWMIPRSASVSMDDVLNSAPSSKRSPPLIVSCEYSASPLDRPPAVGCPYSSSTSRLAKLSFRMKLTTR